MFGASSPVQFNAPPAAGVLKTKTTDITHLRSCTLATNPLLNFVAGVTGFWLHVVHWSIEENEGALTYAGGAPTIGLRWNGFTNNLATTIVPFGGTNRHDLRQENGNGVNWSGGTAATRSVSGKGIDVFAVADVNAAGPPAGTMRISITYVEIPALNL